MEIVLVQDGRRKKLHYAKTATIAQVARELGLNDETFIIKLNGRVAHPKTRLKQGDRLEFVHVIYGG